MNLNTLAAEEADYKSGSLPVALYPNVMRRDKDGKQTFYARPIIRKHLTMDIHTQNCDDILQLIILLKNLLHTLSALIVSLTYNQRIKDT